MSNIAKIVGGRIKNYRLDKHMSRETLAERSNLHPTYIGQLERGEKNATLESITKVATGLEIPVELLLENTTSCTAADSISSKCYELIESQSLAEQEHLYSLLKEVISYKSTT